MRRPTVPSLSLKLVFPAESYIRNFSVLAHSKEYKLRGLSTVELLIKIACFVNDIFSKK
jgi:hypothetical protein